MPPGNKFGGRKKKSSEIREEIRGLCVTYESDGRGDVPGNCNVFQNYLTLIFDYNLDTPGYNECEHKTLTDEDEEHLNRHIEKLSQMRRQLELQIDQMKLMRYCGNQANASIDFELELGCDNSRRYQSNHYCKDHLERYLRKHFRGRKVKVCYPGATRKEDRTEEETLDEHLRKRKNDDYHKGKYRLSYKNRFCWTTW